jgi:hypothetical protein
MGGFARADLACEADQPERAATKLLERWLKAQNEGNFAAYQALYAPGFTGRRRSGERVVELDRAGWMRDRARMFKKKMHVTADDVKTFPGSGHVSITFRQTWSSASYRDVGNKRLMVIQDSGQPQILREDMNTSVKADPNVEPLTDAQVELLHCLFKDIDARWRHADGLDIGEITTAPHSGALAVWVETSNGPMLGICRDSKRIAGGNTVFFGSPMEPMAIISRELQGDYLEVKPGQKALAVVGTIGTYEQVPGFVGNDDGEEGLEEGATGTQLDLFARVGDQLVPIYSGQLALQYSCNFSECTNRDCELTTGKKGPAGWFDLIEKCNLYDVENGRDVKSYRRTTRYVFDGTSYYEKTR